MLRKRCVGNKPGFVARLARGQRRTFPSRPQPRHVVRRATAGGRRERRFRRRAGSCRRDACEPRCGAMGSPTGASPRNAVVAGASSPRAGHSSGTRLASSRQRRWRQLPKANPTIVHIGAAQSRPQHGRRRACLGLGKQARRKSAASAPKLKIALSTLLGDHRAACARSGGCSLERAAARVCREAGACVTCNTLVRDLNVRSFR